MRELLPAFLDLTDRAVLVVGGGPVAAGKLQPLLQAHARVTVVAPDVVPSIASAGVPIHRRPFEPHDLDGCWYVVAAAPPSVNAQVAREAEARRIFVNAVDDPPHATVFAGAVVRRGPVTVSISTGGEAPALARLMREALERLLPESLVEWTAVARALRAEWRRDGMPMGERRSALLDTLVSMHSEEAVPAANKCWRASAESSRTSAGRLGSVAIVGAGPGDAAHLTCRAAECLSAADLVLYDSLVSPSVLRLASRARLVHVGRRAGRPTTSQEGVHEMLIAAVRRGELAVRLKGGDSFVFGRGSEDLLALARAGVPVEVVPGLSSAFAAPALAGIPVTHRGVSAAVLVLTGHDVERFRALTRSVPSHDLTLVVLMGLGVKALLARHLLDVGWPADTHAAVVLGASRPDGLVWSGTLADLADDDPAHDGDVPGLLVIGDVVRVGRDLRAVSQTFSMNTIETEVCHG
ncbi:MAG: uroporphyrinogen-III C-methyltransferase [Acidobacteria bacterium]|nr:uroporphyrinogen-III C-methyltransferase [Acidobacteriota bacterium]